MKFANLNKLAAASALGLAILLGSGEANAQNRNKVQKQQQKIVKQQQKVLKQSLKLEQERLRLERERLLAQQARNNRNNNNRFRVNRGGQWYSTDQRGADLLRQAVNAGYQQGFRAGQLDRNNRRGSNWGNSSIYRSGTYGYQSFVDRSMYQHYFQQGFQRGYQDGYNQQFRYGSNNGGALNILGTILQQVLNIQSY